VKEAVPVDETELTLEDLSQDVYLFGRVRLSQVGWLGLAVLAGLLLMAGVPVPWLSARLLALALPVAVTAWWLHVDGPVWFRRWMAYRRRRASKDLPAMDDVRLLAETVTPLCDLGQGRFLAAAEVVFPPFALTSESERLRRTAAWASLLNACVAHGVQADIFTHHGPWRDPEPFVAAQSRRDLPALRGLAAARVRHFAREAAASSYEVVVVVRLATTADEASDAWQRFRACEAAFQGGGARWDWLSGAYLHELSVEWADPGGSLRRFVAGMEARLAEEGS
jgi:hypothetical protein